MQASRYEKVFTYRIAQYTVIGSYTARDIALFFIFSDYPMLSAPISVIIPTYNRASLLPRAIKSVLKQTFSCNELIIVDDGSTDDTADIIKDLTRDQQHLPFRLISLKTENLGPGAARNKGLNLASQPYVAFLDSDDHWHKRKIEQQYTALKNNPEYRISHTKEKWLRRGSHLNQKKIHIPRQGYIFGHCLQLCAVGMSTVMVEISLIKEQGMFDENLRCCEDYDLWLKISSSEEFLLIDSPLTTKEGGRDDQVSFQYRVGMDKLRIEAIMNLISDIRLREDQIDLAYKELQKKAQIYGKGCIRHGRMEEGNYYLQLAESAKCKNILREQQ